MSETQTMTLTDFLLARIAEDEAFARHVLSGYAEHSPSWDSPSSGVVNLGDPGRDGLLPTGDGPLAHHIARHDPARVLADREAKRRIVERSVWVVEHAQPHEPDAAEFWIDVNATLRDLASVYADHPDYREEWRP